MSRMPQTCRQHETVFGRSELNQNSRIYPSWLRLKYQAMSVSVRWEISWLRVKRKGAGSMKRAFFAISSRHSLHQAGGPPLGQQKREGAPSLTQFQGGKGGRPRGSGRHP